MTRNELICSINKWFAENPNTMKVAIYGGRRVLHPAHFSALTGRGGKTKVKADTDLKTLQKIYEATK